MQSPAPRSHRQRRQKAQKGARAGAGRRPRAPAVVLQREAQVARLVGRQRGDLLLVGGHGARARGDRVVEAADVRVGAARPALLARQAALRGQRRLLRLQPRDLRAAQIALAVTRRMALTLTGRSVVHRPHSASLRALAAAQRPLPWVGSSPAGRAVTRRLAASAACRQERGGPCAHWGRPGMLLFDRYTRICARAWWRQPPHPDPTSAPSKSQC
jgi:hypothetical protein